MKTPDLPALFDMEEADRARMARMQTMADGLDRMLLVATALIEIGREVELAGVESGIGQLCAGVLDLPPDAGRAFRPTLIALLMRLDAAEGTLRLRHATAD